MKSTEKRVVIERGRKSKEILLPEKRCQVGRTIQHEGQQWEVVTVYYDKKRD